MSILIAFMIAYDRFASIGAPNHFHEAFEMTLETFIFRHGEPAIFGMLENWERFMGVRAAETALLKSAWQSFMEERCSSSHYAMA